MNQYMKGKLTKKIIDGKEFYLVDKTSGAILNGVWISKNKQEIKIKIAWLDDYLSFRPLKNEEQSL